MPDASPRPSPAADYYEFGPFRVEVSTRALYRGDEYVPTTPKAFDTLLVLVEEAGRVVTKDELLQRVWPDAFVEEGSIANNISALRKILNPYFEGDGPIATIARRGYRFTAPVQLKNEKAQITTVSDSGTHDVVAEGSAVATQDVPVAKAARTRPFAIAAAIIVALAGVALVTAMRRDAGDPSPVVRRSVAVLPMKNLSGEAPQDWLATALAETISAELAGGNAFRIVSGENVLRMQQELAPPAGVGLTRKQLDDIGRDLACDLILSGNYVVVGGKIRVDVRLDEVATGEAVAAASVTDTEANFLDIVSRAGSELRARLGVEQTDAADADAFRAAFASTPDALRHYFTGLEALRLRDGPRAREALAAAIESDPNFALAHSALSSTWRMLGYDARGAEAAKRAFDLSQRLSREDRIGVEAQYHEASASWPRAIELYQDLWTRYPDNIEYGLKLANVQWLGGRPKDVFATVDQLRRMPERDSRDTRIDLLEATAAEATGDFTRAEAAGARAAAKAEALKAPLLLARARIKQGIYAVRLAKTDEASTYFGEAERLFASMGETGGVADAVRWQGAVLLNRGRFAEARATYERALAMAAPLNYVRLAGELQLALGEASRSMGELGRAVTYLEAAIATARDANNRSLQGRALTAFGSARRLQSDYAAARAAYEQAAALHEAAGEMRQRNAAINNTGVLDYLTGDLPSARRRFEAVLADDRKAGSPVNLALRLSNLSRVLHLQDELAAAEKMNAEECAILESVKAAGNLAWCRTRLANLRLDLDRRADAEALAAQIALADFGKAVAAPVYIARFARVQLRLGHVDAAAAAIAAAEQVQAAAGVVEEQAIHVSVIRAEVDAAQGKRASAIERLQRAQRDADRLGLLTWSLDAQLALARLDPRRSADVARAASEAGFNAIARMATQYLARQ